MLKIRHPIIKKAVNPPELKSDLTFQEWHRCLQMVEQEKRPEWIRQTLSLKKNLHIFGKYFFAHIIAVGLEVPQCHKDLIYEISKDGDSAIIFPRGFAKTTWEKIDTIHDIVYGLEKVILYIANTLSDAQHHFESIKQELENNEALRSIYGDLVPPDAAFSHKWTNRHFETVNGINVVARGAGKGRGVNIKNNRPSKIILDDVEDDEEVRSSDRRQLLHNWIYHVIFPSRNAQKSKIKFIGTVISPLAEILLFYKSHGGIFCRARKDGKSIWPELFSDEKLAQIEKDIGSRAFMQEYMNTPTDPSVSILKMDWIEPYFYSTIPKYNELEIVIMMDPQAGESKKADYYSIGVVGRFRGDRHRYLLELITGRGSQLDQAALFIRTVQKYQQSHCILLACGIEKLMTQVAVYQAVLDWQSGKIDLINVNNDNRNVAIIAVEPEGKDKVSRLQMHQPAFERGEIHLHVGHRAFAEKLVCFPAIDHDDDVDVLMYCLDYCNKSSTNEFWKWQEEFNASGQAIPGVMAGMRDKLY